MSVSIEVLCKSCGSNNLLRNGRSKSGEQRLVCKDCKKTMQLEYLRNGDKPEVKEQIILMAHNGNGVRQTSRILKVGINTVSRTLKKISYSEVNSSFLDKEESQSLKQLEIDFYVLSELDEQWSYVKSKDRWLCLAVDKLTSKVIAFVFGKRTDETFLKLKAHLDKFDIKGYYTDDWCSYKRYLNSAIHHIGKDKTWRVERLNLTLRNATKRLNRRTIGFSKSQTIHDNVMGSFINKYMF